MPGPITKQLAREIAKKLKAVDETDPSDEHDHYAVYHEGELVGSFGIRRASKRDIPCPNVHRDLKVNVHFARELAYCTKFREDWLRRIGKLPSIDDEDAQ